MDQTAKQRETIARLKRDFGRSIVKEHAPDRTTGVVRVTLTCEAGQWEWFFDWNGNYIEGHLIGRLFELPPPPSNPRNAIDN